ncbi:hypothetical protein [Thalassomonas sp. M1454]|uniref:hypothetical protein n=1 Tax=Thalassomonas sp. M1454 TaxID=2594477 RepID=UPI00117DFCB3|nr:hypothetical protein [Thalassomonas sp. M1454]TRX56946.1 hypothetical protein FNN08_05380 [Thalassomonas sp. M1454]
MNMIKKHSPIKKSCLSLCSASLLALTCNYVNAQEIEHEQEVRVIKLNANTAQVNIESNNKELKLTLPADALHDKDKLAQAIAELPEEDQKLILDSLTGLNELHHDSDDVVLKLPDDKEVKEFKWVSDDGKQEKVMVVAIEKSEGQTTNKGAEKHKFIIKSDSKQDGYVSAIKHILAKGTFSKEEIAEIQQALDAKK